MSTIYYRKDRKRYELTIDGNYKGSFKTKKQAEEAWKDLTATLADHESEYIHQKNKGFRFNPMKIFTVLKKKKS